MATALASTGVKECGLSIADLRERRFVSSWIERVRIPENGRGERRLRPAVAASLPVQFVSASLVSKQRGGVSVSASLQGVASTLEESEKPMPVVHIDQESDGESTVVEISFGDRLGALLDTMKALKNLGLNVVRAKVATDVKVPGRDTVGASHKFYLTRLDNGCKVENPELLEAIRLTILNNLLKYHPESSEQLALGAFFGTNPPKVALDIDVATHIHCSKVNAKQSELTVETADRPGLLLEIIKVMTDISITVESAEIDTEGLVAKDKFFVSYGGAALSKSLEEVLVNCLRYYIRRPLTEDDSY